jgi:hypothetical protein
MNGLYVLPTGVTWLDALNQMKQNIELLEKNPNAEHLWHFIESCLDNSRVAYQRELDEKRAAERDFSVKGATLKLN